ncbi:hypothetical protein [Humibacillus xanthopallidus]|uniref:Uncharacterized protein n=1 Tax=Humibacillus xanthopallidus TaxID=412689 RepID=A0A543HGM2_9MICO|nr:hypothetical protein [Humibacillus xanthopallidus]TQM57468.1 hypothetical protein FBY41_4296 [Humibacillus xanthopallidus]
MSNDSTPTQPERPEPRLPQFDPNSAGAPAHPPVAAGPDETQVLPSAPTARTPVVPPAEPYAYAAAPSAAAGSTPAVAQAAPGAAAQRSPRWSAKKTAVTAGLVLVLTSAGAIAAAAAMPSGSTAETGRFGGPGQGRIFPFPGGQGQQGQQGQGQQVLPNLPGQQGGNQLPGRPDADSDGDADGDRDTTRGLGGLDPNQLLGLSPDQLLQLLEDQGQLGSGGSEGLPGSPRDGAPSQEGTTPQDGTARTT